LVVHYHKRSENLLLIYLSDKTPFLLGKEEGIAFKWHRNGKKREESKYKNGVLNGESFQWSERGQLLASMLFKNGKRNGKSKFFYPNGNIRRETIYSKDSVVFNKEYGNKSFIDTFQVSNIKINWQTYGEENIIANPRLIQVGTYQNGNKTLFVLSGANGLTFWEFPGEQVKTAPAKLVVRGKPVRGRLGDIVLEKKKGFLFFTDPNNARIIGAKYDTVLKTFYNYGFFHLDQNEFGPEQVNRLFAFDIMTLPGKKTHPVLFSDVRSYNKNEKNPKRFLTVYLIDFDWNLRTNHPPSKPLQIEIPDKDYSEKSYYKVHFDNQINMASTSTDHKKELKIYLTTPKRIYQFSINIFMTQDSIGLSGFSLINSNNFFLLTQRVSLAPQKFLNKNSKITSSIFALNPLGGHIMAYDEELVLQKNISLGKFIPGHPIFAAMCPAKTIFGANSETLLSDVFLLVDPYQGKRSLKIFKIEVK